MPLWMNAVSLATSLIKDYLRSTARRAGIAFHSRSCHRLNSLHWNQLRSTMDAMLPLEWPDPAPVPFTKWLEAHAEFPTCSSSCAGCSGGHSPVVPVRLPWGGQRRRPSLGTGRLGVLTAFWVRAKPGAGPDRGRKAGPGRWAVSFVLMRGVSGNVSKKGYHVAEIKSQRDLPDHRRRFPGVGHRDATRRHPGRCARVAPVPTSERRKSWSGPGIRAARCHIKVFEENLRLDIRGKPARAELSPQRPPKRKYLDLCIQRAHPDGRRRDSATSRRLGRRSCQCGPQFIAPSETSTDSPNVP
jgi:hypothetical protein